MLTKSQEQMIRSASWSVGQTERKRQEQIAGLICDRAYRYHFQCQDGETFSAIAATEKGAWRVLNAERPGMLAVFTDKTIAPEFEGSRSRAMVTPNVRGAQLAALGVSEEV